MAGTTAVTEEIRAQIVSLVRDFVRRDVAPVAAQYDHDDIYPAELVDTMREMGLFGITIPEEYGGLGLDHATLAVIFEELSRGWMSISGVIGTHHLMAAIIADHGTAEQKQRLLPRMARGEVRAGLGLTEAEAGSDVQNISTTAVRDREEYVLNGSKMFITNAENGNAFAVLAKTDTEADPPYRGMSCFIVEKPNPGLTVGRHVDKLGYRGLDTAELLFEDCRVGAGEPGRRCGGARVRAGDERAGVGPDQRRGARCGRRRGRLPRGHLIRTAPQDIRRSHSRAPGHPGHACRHGD